jgi:mitochondrial fission protein ELM1
MRAISGISGGKMMGLFVGGDNPDFALTRESMNKVIDGALKFAREAGVSILATTSRRTSREIEDLMKKRLSGDENCKLLVIANEKNIDDAVGGILALSDIAIVSGESVSMVSEAISSGKKVVAFRLDKKNQAQTKHERVMNELEKEGLAVVSDPAAVYDSIRSASTKDASSIVSEDRKNVYEAVRRLI